MPAQCILQNWNLNFCRQTKQLTTWLSTWGLHVYDWFCWNGVKTIPVRDYWKAASSHPISTKLPLLGPWLRPLTLNCSEIKYKLLWINAININVLHNTSISLDYGVGYVFKMFFFIWKRHCVNRALYYPVTKLHYIQTLLQSRYLLVTLNSFAV